ncbi:hypothetical protein FQN54_007560 [Arachnomyces sp. PD_36]|nr:hypothetical protein FQN54_007560 [Arachnomyces sp. PD_36]
MVDVHEYGYTCQYNRKTKKRGRISRKVSAAATRQSPYDDQNGEDAQPVRPYEGAGTGLDGPRYEGTAPTASSPSQRDHRALTDIPAPAPQASAGEIDSILDTYTGPSGIQRGRSTLHHILLPTIQTTEENETARTSSSNTLPRPHGAAVDNLYNVIGNHGPSNPLTSPVYSNEAMAGNSDGPLRERPTLSLSVTSEPGHRNLLNGEGATPPTSAYSYKCFEPIISDLKDILPLDAAYELLEVYFAEPCGSLFNGASPFVLTHVLRKKSVLHPTKPRKTTPALLSTMLWCTAQTADLRMFHPPGARRRISDRLYQLSISLLRARDPDNWHRTPEQEGWQFESDTLSGQVRNSFTVTPKILDDRPPGTLDEVLAFTLLTIAVSAGEFKSDSLKWWAKATRLAKRLRLDTEDDKCKYSNPSNTNHSPQSWPWEDGNPPQNEIESKEERRRMFWLLYCLDRHLALSFNTPLSILDTNCQVYAPLSEEVWENLEFADVGTLSSRVYGPPVKVSGTGFFEFFLPLMAILGDIIEAHHRNQHPRLGLIQDEKETAFIEEMLEECGKALKDMELQNSASDSTAPYLQSSVEGEAGRTDMQAYDMINSSKMTQKTKERARVNLVIAYSSHILNVLYVLHHGKWDAISMIDDKDDWITSARFVKCGSHAISACQAVSHILRFDPELTFMPYLFGIYLLHGSFILLLFADRMPQLGPNESVEGVCETIIRAHEVCVVTLSTEFQKNFRKVLRSALYNAWSPSSTSWEDHEERRRELLSLYRWTRGARGLAL